MSEKATINLSVFKRLIAFAKPYKSILLLAILSTLVLSILGPTRPALIGNMVNNYIIKKQDGNMLFFWSMIIIGMLILEGVLQFTSSYLSNLLAQSVIKDLRQKIFGHILSFRMRYFDGTPIGALVTRVVSDLEAITEVFSAGLMDIAGDLLALIIILIWMFTSNWELSIMVIIPIPLLLIATRIFARAMRDSFQLERAQVTKLNNFVQERLTGMNIVQLFNREKQEYVGFEEINKGHRQAHINAVWANSIFFPVVELLSSLSIALLLVYGALKVGGKSQKEISNMYGEIISFILWVNMLYRPIRQLADKFNILQRGTVRAERVFEILDLKEHIQDNGTVDTCDFNQAITFNQVSFAYKNEEWVLKNIDLKIEPGTTVAFVGATGAGKSTIVNLLGRFYEYQKGAIFIGETDLQTIELTYLRKNIAIVLQDVFLFSDTIHNNITLGDTSISREQVIEASKAVGAHDFISKLPNDYDYQVGERGGVLSVGQRQLLSFIRACVYNPHILILDEATSSVDNESEEMIQNATAQLTKGRTSIVIAHRLSTIQNADKIIVLDKGEIKEIGSHAELLQKEGYYRKLYDMQFNEETL
ncbi:MAG: ABC transporter ATP-binding protein [Crocinitomicaceae bacterium]|nr:ABC transporter ATP-binding protein [Crocinitomicaceae bacterium]